MLNITFVAQWPTPSHSCPFDSTKTVNLIYRQPLSENEVMIAVLDGLEQLGYNKEKLLSSYKIRR